MKAAELFVKCLEAEGVEMIYGLPGEENADVMIALEDSSIRFVLCRHEQAAAFMADVQGRLTGKAGVCLGTLGPGATNLVTGIADANMDRAPLVCLTGQGSSERLHKESHQAMDVVNMFKPITKWARSIVHRNNIPEVVRKAFKVAETEKPGACHIELPENLAKKEVTGRMPIAPSKVQRPVPDARTIEHAVALLRDAKRPVILAGNGVIRQHASAQLRALAKASGIGVISTFMGKGVISRQDPHCLFTAGLQSKDLVTCAIDAADVIITVGYDMVEYSPEFWNHGCCKKIIHLDFWPAEIDRHYLPEVEVVGDVAHGLQGLTDQITEENLHWDIAQHHHLREQMLEDFAEFKDDDTEGLIKPQRALWDVREAMGPSDILLSDVGAHKMWIARYYQCDEPNTCLISNGFCSMGFALPGAIAAKMIYPERRVLAICGDAGFLMNVQDLETARRIGVNPVFLIWEDAGYGLIKWKQENEFGRHSELDFTNPDFVQLAEAFDCKGMRVENARDLPAALEEAFTADKPVVMSIPIDYRENRKLTERLGNIACPI